jgi:hypothetical protein
MREGQSRFQEVDRILRENEQLHRRVSFLEVQNSRLSEDLRTAALKMEWIATIARTVISPYWNSTRLRDEPDKSLTSRTEAADGGKKCTSH